MGGQGFPGSRRLKAAADFQAVFKRHKKTANRYFRVLVHYHHGQQAPRLGVIVSRRVSRKSFQRNRIKRQVREYFRVNQHDLCGRDLVVIANKPCESASNLQLQAGLKSLLAANE